MTTQTKPPIDFIVIGAIKAATTWLQAHLQRHPQIFAPDIEPHFFTRAFDRGWDWYRSLFPEEKRDGELWGEKTADYLAKPEAALRIKSAYPDARLIVQLRNPVDRAYSDYKMLYRRGTVTGPPEDYLTSLDSPQPRFLNDGLYAAHLKRWLDLFPANQILVITFEDVRDAPHATYRKVCDHLGLPDRFDYALANRKHNDSAQQLLPLAMRKRLSPLKPLLRPYRDNAIFVTIRNMFARKVDYPALPDQIRSQMTDFFEDDLMELQRMLDRDLTHWLEPCRRSDAA